MFNKAIHLLSFLLALCVGLSATHGQSHLTEEFLGGGDSFDLAYSSVTFTPTSGGASYTYSLKDIAQLPTNPAEGVNLGLGDDKPVEVSLWGNQEVRIFGQSFSTFWVSPNGYITFGQSDWDPSQTLEEHFEVLRISTLYTDLTADWTGAVTRRQLYDRMVITWQAVPEYSDTATNTFQIEMFFDGRIRLSWLETNADECIVGLSNGWGLPDGFVETDFSGAMLLQASEPSPADGARHFDTWASLSWRPGHTAFSHDMYVGRSYSSVYNGTGGTFRGNQIRPTVTIGLPGDPYPNGLVPGTTYYWRIDEVNDLHPDSPWRGEVWSFTAEKHVSVPILEDEQTLDQFDELMILDTPTDLTAGGFASELALNFRGSPGAAAEPIYVTVEDSTGAVATVIHPNPAASQIADPTVWRIELAKFVGVDLTKAVQVSLGIGADGVPAGGPGKMDIIYAAYDSGAQYTKLNILVLAPDGKGMPGAKVSVMSENIVPEHPASPPNPYDLTDLLGLYTANPYRSQGQTKYTYTVTVTKDDYGTYSKSLDIDDAPEQYPIVRLIRGYANDSCENAMPVGDGDLLYDTSNATFDGPGHCIDTPNLWYLYTATGTSPVTVTLEGDNSSVDPKLAIYDGADCYPTLGALIECNDDFQPGTGIWDSQITFIATRDRVYLIEVGSRVNDEGGPGKMTISAP